MSEGDGRRRSRRKGRRKAPPKGPQRRSRAVARPTADALTHQRWLALSAGATALGIALVGIEESLPGSLVALGGLVALMFSIHRFGRLGTEQTKRR